MDASHALVPIEGEAIVTYSPRYADDLAQAGRVADEITQADVFADYQQERADNTRLRQQDDLTVFADYLASATISRAPDALYHDPEAWRGMSIGLVKGFRKWMLEQGYAIGSINIRLATVRQYCKLAREAGVLSEEALDLILTVKGYSHKQGSNIDTDRRGKGVETRKGTKKAIPTPITTGEALRLKKETTRTIKPRTRQHDQLLEARDALLMGLLVEHALRVSEVVALDVSSIDLVAGTVSIYHQKTDEHTTQKLKTHTRLAAEVYLALHSTPGPLFTSYHNKRKAEKGLPDDKRITRKGIYERVRTLGEQLGIEKLSPHDLRHFWTFDAIRNGSPLDKIQSGGNWKSPTMVLRYAKRASIANEGVIITEEEHAG